MKSTWKKGNGPSKEGPFFIWKKREMKRCIKISKKDLPFCIFSQTAPGRLDFCEILWYFLRAKRAFFAFFERKYS